MKLSQKIAIIDQKILDCINSPKSNDTIIKALEAQKVFLKLLDKIGIKDTENYKLLKSKKEVVVTLVTDKRNEARFRGLRQNYTVTEYDGKQTRVEFVDPEESTTEEKEVEDEIKSLRKQLLGLSQMQAISDTDRASLQGYYQTRLKDRQNKLNSLQLSSKNVFNTPNVS